jgi:hypothetical protein
LKNLAWSEYTHSFCSFHFTIVNSHFHDQARGDIGCRNIFITPFFGLGVLVRLGVLGSFGDRCSFDCIFTLNPFSLVVANKGMVRSKNMERLVASPPVVFLNR